MESEFVSASVVVLRVARRLRVDDAAAVRKIAGAIDDGCLAAWRVVHTLPIPRGVVVTFDEKGVVQAASGDGWHLDPTRGQMVPPIKIHDDTHGAVDGRDLLARVDLSILIDRHGPEWWRAGTIRFREADVDRLFPTVRVEPAGSHLQPAEKKKSGRKTSQIKPYAKRVYLMALRAGHVPAVKVMLNEAEAVAAAGGLANPHLHRPHETTFSKWKGEWDEELNPTPDGELRN